MLTLDNSILNQVCDPVSLANPKKNLAMAQRLFQTMIQQRGIGLAANQVGINARLFVMLVDNQVFHCFNPVILESSDLQCDLQEGCLSFPDQFLSIARPEQIRVQYTNAHGKITEQSLSGWAARCFQHELDHLNGITMHERQLGIDIEKT